MQDWDLSKENYQPLKRGRTEVFKDDAKTGQKEAVESQRRYFRVLYAADTHCAAETATDVV